MLLEKIKRFVYANRYEIGVLIFTILYFLWAYFNDPAHPTDLSTKAGKGWFNRFDTGEYLYMALKLPHFKLGKYLYGPGYPFFGALFRNVYPADPFMIPNLIFACIISLLTFRIARKFVGEKWGALTVMFMYFLTPLMTFITNPWNTTLSIVGVMVMLYILLENKLKVRYMLMMWFAVFFMFAARYIDFIWIVPMGALYFWRQLKLEGLKKVLLHSLVFLIPLIIGVFVVLWTHNEYRCGWFCSPFATRKTGTEGVSEQDLSYYKLSDVPNDFVEVFLHYRGKDWQKAREYQKPLLIQSPFLFLTLPGFFILLKKKKWRSNLLTFALCCITGVVFYLSFPPMRGYGLIYFNMRYVMMWMPIWTLFSVLGLLTLLGIKYKQK